MYKLAVIGGTFDHLHKGHETFLDFCLNNSQKILLGLTTQDYAQKSKGEIVQPYIKREGALTDFFKSRHASDRFTILPINSFMYPKVWENLPIDVIIVTKDTRKGAEFLNEERKNRNLKPFNILIAPIILANGEKISSSKIRKGETNKFGISYLAREWFDKDLILNKNERHWFKKPFGKILKSEEIDFLALRKQKIATVGDFITKLFNEKNVRQKISIIDFNIERRRSFESIFDLGFSGDEKLFKSENKAGTLSADLFKTIEDAVKELDSKDRIVINILGEEDLAVLPLVLALPLGWTVFYGQPGKGTVELNVNLKNKDTAFKLLKKFTKKY